MNRREWFTSSSGRAAACEPASGACGANLFTNAVLRTHDNEPVRFYDDVIKGRQVIINMMYADCTGFCPAITSRLVQIHEALKDRMGRDLFMYSITLKPETDDPTSRRFATGSSA
jgi:protein SCO1/2